MSKFHVSIGPIRLANMRVTPSRQTLTKVSPFYTASAVIQKSYMLHRLQANRLKAVEYDELYVRLL